MGDGCEYKHEPADGPQNTPTKSFGVVVVRSLVWPGALSFYYQGHVIQLYVGNGFVYFNTSGVELIWMALHGECDVDVYNKCFVQW